MLFILNWLKTLLRLHRFIVDEFNVGASDEYWLDKNAKYLTMPQVGKKLRSWMDEGVGARR